MNTPSTKLRMLGTAHAMDIDDAIIQQKHVIIVGCGGTGCAVAQLLARLGMKLTIYDADLVSESNLERQVLFFTEDVGKHKVIAAHARLASLCHMDIYCEEVTEKTVLPNADLIIDCTDTMESRRIIDMHSKQKGIPWIYTAAAGSFASTLLVLPKRNVKTFLEKEGEPCCVIGVVNTTVQLAGSLAVTTALNYFAGFSDEMLLRYSCKTGVLSRIRMQ